MYLQRGVGAGDTELLARLDLFQRGPYQDVGAVLEPEVLQVEDPGRGTGQGRYSEAVTAPAVS